MPSVYISAHTGVYMRSRVVSTRVDEDVLKELEQEGISPAEVSQRAIEAEAARIRAQRALGALGRKAVRSRDSTSDIIRRLRVES